MTKTSISDLLTRTGLGFCCPYAGLEANRAVPTGLLAARLGVSARAIRYHYSSLADGGVRCEHLKNCMKERLCPRPKEPV